MDNGHEITTATILEKNRETLKRLTKKSGAATTFQLFFIDVTHVAVRDNVAGVIAASLCNGESDETMVSLNIDASISDSFELKNRIDAISRPSTLSRVSITGADDWLDQKRCEQLNMLREELFKLNCHVFFYLSAESITNLIHFAPDLWSWRSGVYEII